MSEASYAYTAKDGTCAYSANNNTGVKTTGFTNVTADSPDAMKAALNTTIMSVAIQANQLSFQLYTSGVFTGNCGAQLDHGVLAVGYGTQSGTDFYKVKNSWGETWGDAGYILLGRGSQYNNGAGQCGMLSSASYPNL